jgi:transposase, IS30 family
MVGDLEGVVLVKRNPRWFRLPPELRREIIRLRGQGRSYLQIVAELDVALGSVGAVLAPLGGVVRKEMLAVTGRRLTLEDRVEIRLGLERGWSCRRIGAQLGRSASTICREVAAGGGRGGYRPMAAHQRAWRAARRPKPGKLAANPRLCAEVSSRLEQLHSPQQIACWLRQQPDASLGSVSHETIYKSLYVQGRGELRRELARCLRTGRAARKPRGRLETRGKIPGMIMISERPAEADDRAVPGHWEGDLIVGKNNASYIATLVERSTRYVLLAAITDARAQTVAAALAERVTALPAHLWRSLTWDQGREMAGHAAFTIATGIPVYFCDPHSPWQRGSNENTNGLLRQYFPKGTTLSGYTQDDLDAVAIQLNGRPRMTLNWQTPAERLQPMLVATTG